MELRFRPDDRYCKPAIAREEKVTNLMLRVRRRRRQRGCEGCKDGREDSEYSVELLGIANKLLHFPGNDLSSSLYPMLASPLQAWQIIKSSLLDSMKPHSLTSTPPLQQSFNCQVIH